MLFRSLGRGAAVRAGVACAKAFRVSDTTNGAGRSSAALVTEAPVLSSITDALTRGGRVASKDSVAPSLAGIGRRARTAEKAANAAQTNQAADGGGDDSSQRMPPRRGTGQRFGQLVKFSYLHRG